MLAKAMSLGLRGILGYPVQVEVDLSNGLPTFDIVGLPDAAVKESRERVRAALHNSRLEFPIQRVTVNLAPADQRKGGPIYDLPIAVGMLAATGQLAAGALEGRAFVGEVSLDGSLRPVRGILPMAACAREQGCKTFVAPRDNAREAACIEGLEVWGISDLSELVGALEGRIQPPVAQPLDWQQERLAQGPYPDFADVKGQPMAKRALEIAAAGGHNVILVGPPGSGKTLLAHCFPSILPELSYEEALESTMIHSVAGRLERGKTFLTQRPFQAPHHSASMASLVGGGANLRPGEISLAHNGVLFLDELPELSRNALEALRQPMEDGKVTISRAQGSLTYPARFTLIAAMNPCPCGYYGSPNHVCRCTPKQISQYLHRISGPLLDRIDLQLELEAVPYEALTSKKAEEGSASIRERVNRARQVQLARYAGAGVYCNAQLDAAGVRRYCALAPQDQALAKQYYERMGMTARSLGRIQKLARTIADMAGRAEIQTQDLMEAFQYRLETSSLWG